MGIVCKDWYEVLRQLEKEDPNSVDFYMLRMGDGDNQQRSRFMTRNEAIGTVKAEIERTKKFPFTEKMLFTISNLFK